MDLPQTLLEPILLRYATQHGFQCRMNTKFISFEQDEKNSTTTTTVLDKLTNQTYKIRSRFLFGADGARSAIVKQLDLPLDAKPGQGIAMDFLVKTDLSHLVQFRTGNLHWLIQPDVQHPAWGWLGVARMVKPWTEWIFTMFPALDYDPESGPEPSEQDYLKRIKEFIGDDTPAEIIMKSKWYINEIVAKEYSKGNVICLGDAVHRHPPMNGLGSNTCIQDSFNLAWKVAYVMKGLASPSLLATYTPERQPVGTGIISRANDSYRNHRQIWEALGILSPSVDERKVALEELSSPSAAGTARRKALRAGIEHSAHEFHALGIEMNQRYESEAIYTADEPKAFAFKDLAKEDPVLYYVPNTHPGSRLPHAWLNRAVPETPISTVDLAGKGAWTVITGIGGEGWKSAAVAVGQELGIEINVYSVGFGQDWEDVYYDWEKVRGVEESGSVLVRPDRFVAWRAAAAGKEKARLMKAMRILLGLEGS